MSRRSFIQQAVGTAFWLLGWRARGTEANKRASTLTILHTNDLHGHLTAWQGWDGDLKGKTIGGLAHLASAINLARKEAGDAVLLLDAGDLIGDTMIADLTEGQALIRVFNHLKYDAMTFGNHEPDFGMAALRERIKEAKFPFVAANLIKLSDRESFFAPYVIKKLAGISVGIIGLTYPKTLYRVATNSMFAKGGHNQRTFLQGHDLQEHGSQFEAIKLVPQPTIEWIPKQDFRPESFH